MPLGSPIPAFLLRPFVVFKTGIVKYLQLRICHFWQGRLLNSCRDKPFLGKPNPGIGERGNFICSWDICWSQVRISLEYIFNIWIWPPYISNCLPVLSTPEECTNLKDGILSGSYKSRCSRRRLEACSGATVILGLFYLPNQCPGQSSELFCSGSKSEKKNIFFIEIACLDT